MKKKSIISLIILALLFVASPEAAAESFVITPLDPPESLVIPPSSTEIEFDDFIFDDDMRGPSLDWSTRIRHEYHDVSGAGSESSFLERGNHIVGEVELLSRSQIGANWESEFSSLMQLTQSRRYDPSDFSFRQLRFTLNDLNNTNLLVVGDYYASFSQFSMNRSIKGAGYQRNFSDNTYVRLAGGSYFHRWDHLAGSGSNRPIDRKGLGARFQFGREDGFMGINYAAAWDWDKDPERTTQTTFRQHLASLDWELHGGGLNLSGEHAYAPTRRQPSGGDDEMIYGAAHRVNSRMNIGHMRLQLRGEHISPDFISMSGGASPDRFRIFSRGDFRINNIWSIYAGNDWYRNNLEDQREATTRTFIPEAGVRTRGLFERRSLMVSAGVRRRISSTDKPSERVNISDRLHINLSDRLGALSLRGETEIIFHNSKKPSPSSKGQDYLYRLTADSRHTLFSGNFEMRPFLSLSHQEVEDQSTGKPVMINSLRFDLRGRAADTVRYGLSMEKRSNKSDIPGRDDSEEERFSVSLEKSFDFLGGASVEVEYGVNRYGYSDTLKDYEENFFQFSFNRSF